MNEDLGTFEAFCRIVAKLRSPEGCPWDRRQTHESLKPYLIEEAYETLQTLEDGDADKLCEELGDVLLDRFCFPTNSNNSTLANVSNCDLVTADFVTPNNITVNGDLVGLNFYTVVLRRLVGHSATLDCRVSF